ncbi:SRPBCC family protein [Denitrobaculum tricleocarpae]|uniref:Vanillate O-demethylase oxidoreductase VanB n=1 Tax=Denitrobaculum tricleocarpae TaxID=2591009 RepID=A0A545TPV0_9PROT|nr:SRPBCC family protein [Denitrobaculum tricleocarpae]TQV79181.1 vanillate O-demethylase oxidoreductase VanB [Denitrobaculum tricleocarpae]
MQSTEDKIEKTIDLAAPLPRVWRALTDHREFGEWFQVKLSGPFRPGAVVTGQMTFPGYEDYPWRARVERMEPETLFSFKWHDFDEKSDKDVSEQPTTLVEFRLEAIDGGSTRLHITESGFAALPDPRRLEVLRENTKGWEIQADNIKSHVTT